MQGPANFQVHKIAAAHVTHRPQTLQAISQKAHAIDSRIEVIRSQANKAQEALRNVPEDTVSRLQWLQQQLSN